MDARIKPAHDRLQACCASRSWMIERYGSSMSLLTLATPS
jgi:hypothetical protein